MQTPLPPQFNMQPVVALASTEQSLGSNAYSQDTITDGTKLEILNRRIYEIITQNEAASVNTAVSLFDMSLAQQVITNKDTQPQFAASINKLPIAFILQQDLRSGSLALTDTVTWTEAERLGGYGSFDQAGAATSATVGELITDMLTRSGNTAVRVLVNYTLGGPENVNDRLGQYAELPATRLQIVNGNSFYMGNTTSAESLWTIQQLLLGNDEFQSYMKEALRGNIFDTTGVKSQLAGNGFVVLANKVGILDDPAGNNRHDVGIIYNTHTGQTIGYSFMTTTPYDKGSEQAQNSLVSMGHETLQYAGDTPVQAMTDGGKGAGTLKAAPDNAVKASMPPETKILY